MGKRFVFRGISQKPLGPAKTRLNTSLLSQGWYQKITELGDDIFLNTMWCSLLATANYASVIKTLKELKHKQHFHYLTATWKKPRQKQILRTSLKIYYLA